MAPIDRRTMLTTILGSGAVVSVGLASMPLPRDLRHRPRVVLAP
jgi:hypothetical protein